MPAVSNALVVGGGAAGTTTAILLADAGVSVDLVEIKSEVTALGSGITLQGNALRVLKQLNVLDRCAERGYSCNKLVIRAPDPAGTVVAEVSDIPFGGPDVPTTMGMYRPDLAQILVERAEAAGVKIRYSTTVDSLTQDADGVDVTFSDGSTGRYDVVVGADGLRSWTRRLLEIPLETRALGLGSFRMFAPRPASVTDGNAIFGGPSHLAIVVPTSETTAYWSILETARDRTQQSPEERLADFVELSRGYHGPWDEVRDSFTDPSKLHYTVWEHHLLDAPWNRGRVVLIGDAVHVTPPTIAQGAAMGFEDGAVLAELLISHDRVDDELWDAFTARRFDRVKTVVDASMQIAAWERDHVQGDVPSVTRRVAAVVSQPA
jgi:2-polyprenyl-6-methoxyphenol hydroxylase-like FAD-dependent oxidoreductase